MTKQWKFYEENNEQTEKIANEFNISKLVAGIIANRNIGNFFESYKI